jgi:hypothetical protein
MLLPDIRFKEMTRPILVLYVLFAQFLPLTILQGDVIDDLSEYFKSGNSKEISKYFSNSVELIISDEQDVYSKAQAEQIIRDFFSKNEPSKSTVVHHINTNPNFRFGILSLITKGGKFRVSVTLKKSGSSFLITELRMEPDK